MPKARPPYAPEFRRQMVELVRAGRDTADLSREFEPSAQAESKAACFSCIEGFCNPVRLHSAPGYQSPISYEKVTTPEITTHTQPTKPPTRPPRQGKPNRCRCPRPGW